MSLTVRTVITDVDGNEADVIAAAWLHTSPSGSLRRQQVIPVATKTQLVTPFSTISFVYLETTAEIRVYKDLSPEYWVVDGLFFAFDCDIDQLHVYASDGATVTMYIGGTS